MLLPNDDKAEANTPDVLQPSAPTMATVAHDRITDNPIPDTALEFHDKPATPHWQPCQRVIQYRIAMTRLTQIPHIWWAHFRRPSYYILSGYLSVIPRGRSPVICTPLV